MIGDSNGNTCEYAHPSMDNPFIERFVKLINKLKPLKGHWGIVFDGSIYGYFNEGQITEEEYHFLERTMFESIEYDDKMVYTEQELEYLAEFIDGITGETEYSFLCFEGCTLTYFDEFGDEHQTQFVD